MAFWSAVKQVRRGAVGEVRLWERVSMATASVRIPFTYRYGNVGLALRGRSLSVRVGRPVRDGAGGQGGNRRETITHQQIYRSSTGSCCVYVGVIRVPGWRDGWMYNAACRLATRRYLHLRIYYTRGHLFQYVPWLWESSLSTRFIVLTSAYVPLRRGN